MKIAGEANETAANAKSEATAASEIASEAAENSDPTDLDSDKIASTGFDTDAVERLLSHAKNAEDHDVLAALIKRPKIKRATSSLASELQIPRSTVYRALDSLLVSGVVTTHLSRSGNTLYRLNDGAIKDLVGE